MPMSQVVKYSSSSFLQSACARLNPYGRRHHYEKEISLCIHDKSILLLGHRGAYDMNAFSGHWIYWLTNRVHSFSSINHFKFKFTLNAFIWYNWMKDSQLVTSTLLLATFLIPFKSPSRKKVFLAWHQPRKQAAVHLPVLSK
jgi:hypothetical protein